MSLIRKMPSKRGFRPPFRVEYTPINLSQLNDRFEAGATVDGEALHAAGLLKRGDEPFKVLAEGELEHALTITAPRVSAAARTKIEAAGGSIDAQDPMPRAARRAAYEAAKRGDAEASEDKADEADSGAADDAGADEDDATDSDADED